MERGVYNHTALKVAVATIEIYRSRALKWKTWGLEPRVNWKDVSSEMELVVGCLSRKRLKWGAPRELEGR